VREFDSLTEPPLTTSDAAQPFLFRSVKGSRREIQPVACALIVEPTGALPVATIRLAWSQLLAARLRDLARAAAQSGVPEGKSLPFASLRAALQAQLPAAMLLARDLGAPWKREERFPFLDVEASDTAAGDPAKLAASALKTWMTMVLRPWADRVGIDDDLIDHVQELCTPDAAFEREMIDADLGERLREGETFERLKHGILQVIAKRLEGRELFDGLGPVYRIVRGSSASNSVSFQTWPGTTSSGGRYSMMATLTVESGAYLGTPVVTVKTSRRRWYDSVPDAKRLWRLRTMTGTIMGRNGTPVAVDFTTPVYKGVPEEPFTPEFMIQALNVRQDFAASLADMVARQGSQGIFVGIPYSSQLGGQHPVGDGATTRDQLDLFDAVTHLLQADGFRPLPFRQTEENKKAPKRAEDQHKAIQSEGLIADIALSLGRNNLDAEALELACGKLMSGEVPDIRPETAAQARAALEEIRAANRDRLRRAFGDVKPTVVVLARTERERAVMRACIDGLFGRTVSVAEYQLPAAVHGARPDLPKANGKAKERFAARVEAWTPLAAVIADEHGGSHALVQAADRYDRRKDDPVNKLAGRYALAAKADANVQYLRPCEPGWRGLANYLHRIQSGVYDLLFGHSGLVSEVSSLLKGAFAKDADRPRAIIGVSVVAQARLRYGAGGGRICLATRIDAATGKTTARVGWFKGRMLWTPQWEPFFEAMKRIASPDITASLGDGRNVERDSFQKFVKTIIDDSAQAGDRPLVLIDSTSAAGLWSWLTDREIGEAITLGSERVDMASRWPGVRIVRVRTGRAGRVVERKTSHYERVDNATGQPTSEFVDRYCPSITERTIRLADGPGGRSAHYWVTAGYFQMSIPRGLSVYRNLASFFPAKKEKGLVLPPGAATKGLFTQHTFDIAAEPYRLPNPIEVTVAVSLDGDDPDRITHLVASLRCGYGHTRATTSLPAPLFFETKARDYMTRFALDEADAEDILDSDAAAGVNEVEGSGSDAPDPDGTGGALAYVVDGDVDVDTQPEIGGLLAGRVDSAIAVTDGESDPEVAEDILSTATRQAASPEPLDSWSALLSRFDVGRTNASSTVGRMLGSTSLSSRRTERPFGTPSIIPKALPGLRRISRAPTGTAAAVVRSAGDDGARKKDEADDNDKAEGDDGMATNRNLSDMWPGTAREPVLPVPPFVNREWLTQKVSAPPSLLREIHRWRSEIRSLSGYPWPKERPTPEQFLDVLLNGMRFPGFVRAVTRVAARHIKPTKKRAEFSLFGPFKKSSDNILRSEAERLKRKPATKGIEKMRILARDGHPDAALALIYLTALGDGDAHELMSVADEFPKELGAIVPFLEAAKVHFEDDGFNWRADIIEQRGAPMVPPHSYGTDAPDSADASSGLDGSKPAQAIRSTPVVEDPSDADEHAAQPAALIIGIEQECLGAEDSFDAEPEPVVEHESLGTEEFVAAEDEGDAIDMANAGDSIAPAPYATSDQDSAETVSESAAEWASAMVAIRELADTAVSGNPDAAAIPTLLAGLKRARSAARRWEAAQPKRVEVAPLVGQMHTLAAELRGMLSSSDTDEALQEPEGVVLVTQAAGAAIERILTEARRLAGEAASARSDAIAMMVDFERLEEAADLKKRSRDLAIQGMAALRRVAPALADGAVTTQPARPRYAVKAAKRQEALVAEKDIASAATLRKTGSPGSAALERGSEPSTFVVPLAVSRTKAAPAAEVSLPRVDSVAEPTSEAVDNEDDAARELISELADADASVEDGEASGGGANEGLDAPTIEVVVTEIDDPFAQAVERRLSELFGAHEFGLAYHLLRAARRTFSERSFLFSEPELRLAAIAGYVNHAAMQGNAPFDRLLEEVLLSAQKLHDSPADIPTDLASARRIMLFGATAAFALFHPGTVASQVLETLNEASSLGEGFYPLKDALAAATRSGIGVTPAMLRQVSQAVKQTAEEDRYGADCLKAIRDKIELFSKMRFRFTLGNRIRATLVRNDGVIGILKERLGQGDKAAVDAAREFAGAYNNRGAIIALLNLAEAVVNTRVQGIDGDARERVIATILDLVARCTEFVQAHDAAPAMKRAGQRALVRDIRAAIIAGLDRAEKTLSGYAQTAGPLSAAASAFTLMMLTQLRAAADGSPSRADASDHLLAIHGPLLWLRGLHFGRSWLPSPYQPEIIINAILGVSIPLLPQGDDRFPDLERMVRARMAEDSFVAAHLLAEGGAFFGATDAQRGELREFIEAAIPMRRDALADDIAEVRRMVDRVQRMGMLAGVDDAQSFLSLLDRIEVEQLPAEVTLDARAEDEESEAILDFASAEGVLDDVRAGVERLLDKPRRILLDRLGQLVAAGRVQPEYAEKMIC
jgi:hypothetical protein